MRGRVGEAGYCPSCERHMEQGPDACLGVIPGVSHACCGHGFTVGGKSAAYVVIGGYPDQPAYELPVTVELRGETALSYFSALGIGPNEAVT